MVSFQYIVADCNDAIADSFDYCVHCRCSLRNPKKEGTGCGERGAADGKEGGVNRNSCSYAPDDDQPIAMRCSRCCAVHYCSRRCQIANYPLHKKRCKTIQALRTATTTITPFSTDDGTNPKRRMALAHHILDLAYCSTDTIDRGRYTYNLALVEFYKLLRIDFASVGALQSVLLLSAILGYERICLGLIEYCLHSEEVATTKTESIDEDSLLEWIYGDTREASAHTSTIAVEFDETETQCSPYSSKHKLKTKIPWQPHWCPNTFLVPLMLIQLRMDARGLASNKKQQQPQPQDQEHPPRRQLRDSARLCRLVEFATNNTLPVLRSLDPGSMARWGELAAVGLFTGDCESNNASMHCRNEEPWPSVCGLFWMLLRDCVAFTPCLSEALEETIAHMESDNMPVLPECWLGGRSDSSADDFPGELEEMLRVEDTARTESGQPTWLLRGQRTR